MRCQTKSCWARFCGSGLLALVLFAVGGCQEQRPDKAQLAPVEYFQKTQANTETPGGHILTSTVREVAPYVLEYQTDGGQTYQVRYTDHGKGFRYYDSRRVENQAAEVAGQPAN